MPLNHSLGKNSLRAKNSWRALAFNLIDLDNNQIFKDIKKVNVIKNLRKDFVLLKPDEGNGIVLIKTTEYYSSLGKPFSDKSKFKQISEDDEFAINSKIFHTISSILFIYLNIRLKIRWNDSDYSFYYLFSNGELVKDLGGKWEAKRNKE